VVPVLFDPLLDVGLVGMFEGVVGTLVVLDASTVSTKEMEFNANIGAHVSLLDSLTSIFVGSISNPVLNLFAKSFCTQPMFPIRSLLCPKLKITHLLSYPFGHFTSVLIGVALLAKGIGNALQVAVPLLLSDTQAGSERLK